MMKVILLMYIFILQMIKRYLLYLSIAIAPFLVVVLVNEVNRTEETYMIRLNRNKVKIPAYNSDHKSNFKCTWYCHTVKCSHGYSNRINQGIIKVFYTSIVEFNGNPQKLSSGINLDYQAMNILLLVVMWPLFMYFLILHNIRLFLKLKSLKK